MIIHFDIPGKKRKELAQAISAWTGLDLSYAGAPTFSYIADGFEIDRDGNLKLSDTTDGNVIERLLQHLYDEGFSFETPDAPANATDEDNRTAKNESEGTISFRIPLSTMDEAAVANLKALLEAKGALIKAALGEHFLPVCWSDDGCIDFPWLPADAESSTVNAWMKFISALCEMARNAKRVTAKEKESDNARYDFRCFLLRLGFIGADYKNDRKILLKNLSGSSAFKGGARNALPR